MTITRDQFIRGFNAVRLAFGRQTAMNIAALENGLDDFSLGLDPAVYELQRQLEERCGDDPGCRLGTMISYALHERMECGDPSAGVTMTVDSAEALWTWWEKTKTGPFSPTEGLVLVPRVPTDAMLQGACRTHTPGVPMSKDHGECPSFNARRRAWADMVERAGA